MKFFSTGVLLFKMIQSFQYQQDQSSQFFPEFVSSILSFPCFPPPSLPFSSMINFSSKCLFYSCDASAIFSSVMYPVIRCEDAQVLKFIISQSSSLFSFWWIQFKFLVLIISFSFSKCSPMLEILRQPLLFIPLSIISGVARYLRRLSFPFRSS